MPLADHNAVCEFLRHLYYTAKKYGRIILRENFLLIQKRHTPHHFMRNMPIPLVLSSVLKYTGE